MFNLQRKNLHGPSTVVSNSPVLITCVQAAGREGASTLSGFRLLQESWRYSIGSHLVRVQSVNQSGFL